MEAYQLILKLLHLVLSKLLLCCLFNQLPPNVCTCEKGFKHFSVHFQATNLQAYNPLIMPPKQTPFTVIYSTCYRRVFCRARLTEHIPNVSRTPGTYQLDTDLPRTHVPLKECVTGRSGSYTWCSALFAGWKYKRRSSSNHYWYNANWGLRHSCNHVNSLCYKRPEIQYSTGCCYPTIYVPNIYPLHRLMEDPSLLDFI